MLKAFVASTWHSFTSSWNNLVQDSNLVAIVLAVGVGAIIFVFGFRSFMHGKQS